MAQVYVACADKRTHTSYAGLLLEVPKQLRPPMTERHGGQHKTRVALRPYAEDIGNKSGKRPIHWRVVTLIHMFHGIASVGP